MPDDADEELAAIRRRLMQEMMARSGGPPAAAPAAPATPPPPAFPDAPDAPVVVTDATFAAATARYPVALVDFWAPWCGPCKQIAPAVEDLAREMRGAAAFLKLNVDDSPRTAQAFGVQSIPTLLLFKGGKAVDGVVGAVSKTQIAALVRRHIQRETRIERRE